MCKKEELEFSVFLIHQLSYSWKMIPAQVYDILNKTGILDNYIVRCYDVLHTMGELYLVNDITDFVREKGVAV
ncbi:DUF3791 domain-containing protein [bacterium]|jgi:hypothetical protein|nr:DUF3791 domain-containing protein [bacterium]MBP5591923.1 DUF3791 domain-containing protein [bacterium]MBR4532217.1 DUF3791 domain-containing protein [bacterium]